MDRAETFSIVLIVLCVAALGIGIILEASKYALLRSKRTVLSGKLTRRKGELDDATKRAETREAEAAKLQRELETLNADRLRTLSLMKTIAADKIEMVHELGSPDRSTNAFESALIPTADLNRLDEKRLMFHRDIWKRRNTAWVWADTPEDAKAALERVFSARSAVSYSTPKPHPELSKLPQPVRR